MQSTGLNALVALVAAPPPQASNASANSADDGAPQGQQFSQLLSDSGKQSDGQQSGQQGMTAKMLQASTSAAAALSAQEVMTPAEQLAQLLSQREQLVTPDDAATLVKHIDAMAAQTTNPADAQALAQIKQQLQNIVTTGAPKSVAEILAAAPAVKEAKISLVGLTALLSGKKTTSVSTDVTHADADTSEEGETPAVAVQTVPVQVFRPDAGEIKADAPTAKSDPKKETVKKDAKESISALSDVSAKATTVADASLSDMSVKDTTDTTTNVAASGLVTVMIPLAASMTQAAVTPVANTSANTSDISITDTMPPAAMKPRSDLDQILPPLTSNVGDEDNDALPTVNLPQAADVTSDAKAASANAMATATGAAADATKADAAKVDAKQAATAQSDLSAINNLTQTPGATPTQTTGAVQSINVVQTPGLVNHASVSDQVSVGVTKAAKDGIDHITIQLDPAGLGRVEVNMHTSHDGQTQISFTVDKASTFDNLSRDARSLERSLQEAGIKADTGSMQFNMRQQPQAQLQSNMNNHGQGQPQQNASAQDDSTKNSSTHVASIVSPAITRNYLINVREGVDISA